MAWASQQVDYDPHNYTTYDHPFISYGTCRARRYKAYGLEMMPYLHLLWTRCVV